MLEEINKTEKYLSVAELADTLQMSKKGILDLVHKHSLPAAKIGKAYRIKESEFIRFFEENRLAR